MLVPFGTHVVDKHGKSVGTVSRVVLDSQEREVVSLVVHHGVLNRREVEVPLSKVTDRAFGAAEANQIAFDVVDPAVEGAHELPGVASLFVTHDHFTMPAAEALLQHAEAFRLGLEGMDGGLREHGAELLGAFPQVGAHVQHGADAQVLQPAVFPLRICGPAFPWARSSGLSWTRSRC